ncbi:LysR family transcriptional regulator [Rothia sp. CCM 9418]|uniref:LysR family transcriptional regulator n=1 Tax=Rothia sp. CCM 9418 TaxID=3402661 RepID=UPI003AEC672B
MYDIHRLRILLEIHERGSLAAASRTLHLTSSAISQQMTALEKEAGAPLIRRSGRSVRLTDEGLILVHGARAILREMDKTATRIAQFSGEPLGTVRLAIFQSAAIALLPTALSYLQQNAPQLILEVVQIDPETGLELTRSRQFDLAITESYPHHFVPEHEDLQLELLTADPIHLVLAQDSPYTTLTEAKSLPWVFEREHNTSRIWGINQCRQAGFEPQVRYSIEDLLTHVRLAEQGYAAAILPGFVTSSTHHKTSIKLICLPEHPERQIFTASRIDSAGQPNIAMVRRALSYAAGALKHHQESMCPSDSI